jgi:D-sedoheptulose 7-phosphate isomerase
MRAIESVLAEHQQVISALSGLVGVIDGLARTLTARLAAGGKVVLMGNGGTAADSQHLASEFVGRFRRERQCLAAMALTTDSSILTSLGNDFGF